MGEDPCQSSQIEVRGVDDLRQEWSKGELGALWIWMITLSALVHLILPTKFRLGDVSFTAFRVIGLHVAKAKTVQSASTPRCTATLGKKYVVGFFRGGRGEIEERLPAR